MAQIIQDDAIQFLLRAGTSTDPYVNLTNAPVKIVNNNIQIQEIPDKVNGVIIDGFYEVKDTEWQTNPTLASNAFHVDYGTGEITFNPSVNGQSVQPKYYGRGIVRIPASRVYVTGCEIPWAIDTLQEFVEMINKLIDEMNQTAQNEIQKVVDFNNIMTNFKYCGLYNNTTQYHKWNIVQFNGGAYICLIDTKGNPPDTSNNWGILCQKGDKGDSIHWRGTYSPIITYNYLDLVIYNSRLYMCVVQSSQNILPMDSDNWALLFDNNQIGDVTDSYYSKFLDSGIIITHNLNDYPHARAIAMNSYGHGGFGMFDMDGSIYEESILPEYIDTNTIRLYLIEEYDGQYTVTKVSDMKYQITFSEEVNPLIIKLSLE